MKALITGLLIALTVSACGWHLRGASADKSLSVNDRTTPLTLYISSIDNYSALVSSLRQQFHTFNVTEAETQHDDALTLNIVNLKFDKRAAGVGADALVNVYELTLVATYEVTQGEMMLTKPHTRALVSRTYNFEVNQVNYSEQEEALILREMNRDIAQQILRRLKVISNR